jgi:transposase
MRPQRPVSESAKESLEGLLAKTKSKADFQRVQCVWLRVLLGLSSILVAKAIGWSPGTVKQVWSRFFADGESALVGKGRGGRRRQNLSIEEEEILLERFLGSAKAGNLLVVSEVKAAYEEAVGRRVPKSTVYRMLTRHGWRKISPRPRHPKSDPELQESFKKTSGNRSRSSSSRGR